MGVAHVVGKGGTIAVEVIGVGAVGEVSTNHPSIVIPDVVAICSRCSSGHIITCIGITLGNGLMVNFMYLKVRIDDKNP